MSRGPRNRGGHAEGSSSEAPPTAKRIPADDRRAPPSAPMRSLCAWYWAAHPASEGHVPNSTQGHRGACRHNKLAPAGVHRAMPTYNSTSSRYRHRDNPSRHRHACKGNPSRYRHRSSPSRYRHPHHISRGAERGCSKRGAAPNPAPTRGVLGTSVPHAQDMAQHVAQGAYDIHVHVFGGVSSPGRGPLAISPRFECSRRNSTRPLFASQRYKGLGRLTKPTSPCSCEIAASAL